MGPLVQMRNIEAYFGLKRNSIKIFGRNIKFTLHKGGSTEEHKGVVEGLFNKNTVGNLETRIKVLVVEQATTGPLVQLRNIEAYLD